MSENDLKYLQSWFIAIMATSDLPETERSIAEMCEVLGIEPVTRYRWLTDETIMQYAKTVRKVAMELYKLEQELAA